MNRRFVVLLLILSAGCSSALPSAMPQSLSGSGPRVYLLRGFLGLWSHGMDQLADSLRQRGIAAKVYADDDWRAVSHDIFASTARSGEQSQIILVGHSFVR